MSAHPSHADDDLAVLASSPLCQVSACPGCGVVHLHLPSMTLRFEPAAFHEVARLVAQASLALEGGSPAATVLARAPEQAPLAASLGAAHPPTGPEGLDASATAPPRRRWH